MGSYGAVAEFCVGADEPIEIDLDDLRVVAITGRGALRFQITDQILRPGADEDQ